VKALGYASRDELAKWIDESAPGKRKAWIKHGKCYNFPRSRKKMQSFICVQG